MLPLDEPGTDAPLERELRQLARRQTGCRALMRHYGVGELGDVTQMSASRKASAAPASTSACTAPTAAPGQAS